MWSDCTGSTWNGWSPEINETGVRVRNDLAATKAKTDLKGGGVTSPVGWVGAFRGPTRDLPRNASCLERS